MRLSLTRGGLIVLKADYQFEVYRHALARLEARNQAIIKALRLGTYQQALEYATTPADAFVSRLDFDEIIRPKKECQLDLFGGKNG